MAKLCCWFVDGINSDDFRLFCLVQRVVIGSLYCGSNDLNQFARDINFHFDYYDVPSSGRRNPGYADPLGTEVNQSNVALFP